MRLPSDLDTPQNWTGTVEQEKKLRDRRNSEMALRLLRVIRGTAECPRCGASGNEFCLNFRGDSILDGTTHEERKQNQLIKAIGKI